MSRSSFLAGSAGCRVLAITALLMCAATAGCLNNGMKRQETGDPAHPTVYTIREDDAEIRAAMMVARYRFREFEQAYAAASRRDSGFAIKVPLSDSTSTEDLWITVIGRQEQEYLGLLINKPAVISGVKPGDTVAVAPADISDWAYKHDGRPVGDFTTRVIRNRLEPKEREAFDRQTGGVYAE